MSRCILKAALIWMLIMIVLPYARSQHPKADSLFAVWSDTTNLPIDRLNAFYQRFDPLLRTEGNNPEAGRWAPFVQEGIALVNQLGKKEYLARFTVLASATFMLQQDFENACPLAQQAFDLSLELSDDNSSMAALYIVENCMLVKAGISQNQLDSNYQRITAMIDNKTVNIEQAILYNILARYHYTNSDFPKALFLFRKTIQAYEAKGITDQFPYMMAIAFTGSIHSKIGNYEEAERYMLKALALFQSLDGYADEIGSSYIDLAMLYQSQKDNKKAVRFIEKAMTFMKGREDCRPCMMKAKWVKASIDNLTGNYLAALQELLEAEDHYRNATSRADLWNRCRFFSTLGTTYLGLGQTQKAIESAQTGLGFANGNLFASLGNLEVLYQAYEAQGNYQKTLDYYRSFTATQDSIVQLRNSQEVTRLELENQFQQQRLADSLQLAEQTYLQELAYQAQISEQKTTRNILIGLAALTILLLLGLASRLRYTRKAQATLQEKNRIIESEKEKAQASEHAKHQFLANMSHEIRTPMNAIKGMTDILLRREPQAQQLSYLNAIKESSNSLLVIINDILDISKIEAGKIDLEHIPFSLAEVIQNVITITQFKAEEKGLLLQTDIPENMPSSVQGDPTRLHQVLLNLVGNAIKFTEKGVVTIQLKTNLVEKENQVLAHFCVSDTGVGIGADRLEKIFETFEQAYSDTSRKFGGTGLGLSISKKLVEIQQGKIWAESQKGKGSKFYFSIPFEMGSQTKDAIATPELANSYSETLKAIKVLLVEDNQFNAIVAQEELEDAVEDVVVEVAENGVIAVEKATHTDFDIILMDVQMPVMNGYEATKAIRNLSNGKSQIPIIAMTANVMKEEIERCYETGMNDFIGKPFDIDDLLAKIQRLLVHSS